jgi:type II secretory pathway component PulF
VLADLKSGVSLGEAFEKCSSVFDEVVIGLLKSAEKTGKIADIISNILKFLELQSNWKNHVKRAIAYPIFIACVAMLVMILSISLLGPQVMSLIQNAGTGDIPLLTQFIVGVLPVVSKITCCFIPIILLIFLLLTSSESIKFAIMEAVLRIPKLGPLIAKISFWHFCKILHMALEAKLDFVQAMDLAIDATKILNIKNELMAARNLIVEGHSISASFSKVKFISGAVISTVDIGEEGSNLSMSFNHMSSNQYDEIVLDIKAIGQNLSVGITLFTGMIFVLILCGLFFPIYSYVEMAGT